MAASKDNFSPNLAVYLHWPFCLAKCPYCDFNSHVRSNVEQETWRREFLTEIDGAAAKLGPRNVTSIFFGGGTPSLMPPSTVGALLDRIAAHWTIDTEIEINLEANPSSVDVGNFKGFAVAGVNRLSLGVQALNDQDLRRLGRNHNVQEALSALELACHTFDACNFDLIYARPGQDLKSWQSELKTVLDMAPKHLSLYQLTIESGTAFKGTVQAAHAELGADLYLVTQELCVDAGLPAYEISSHSAPGQECRHNLTYWRYGEYLGLGPGAHGRLRQDGQRIATSQRTSPENWLKGERRESCSVLTADERAAEMVMMGLRLTEGIHSTNFKKEVGIELVDWLESPNLQHLLDEKLLLWKDAYLTSSSNGRLVLNALLAQILPFSIT